MAKIERYINEDFDQLLSKIEDGIINGSMSATLEDASDFRSGTARCSVRVFERYSYAGGNRVSLNITLFQNDKDPVQLSAITAGGSQAVFFKIMCNLILNSSGGRRVKRNYWALLVFVLIIVLQWIGLGYQGQIKFIFLIIILVLIVLFAILLRKK